MIASISLGGEGELSFHERQNTTGKGKRGGVKTSLKLNLKHVRSLILIRRQG